MIGPWHYTTTGINISPCGEITDYYYIIIIIIICSSSYVFKTLS